MEILKSEEKYGSWTKSITQAEQADRIIGRLLGNWKITEKDWGDFEEDVELVKNHIELLRRQAQKAKNQRKTLKRLNESYQAIIMENRWLRSELFGHYCNNGKNYMDRAEETLWKQFKKGMKNHWSDRYIRYYNKIGEALKSVREYRDTGEPKYSDDYEIKKLINKKKE